MKISCIWRKIYRNGLMTFGMMLMAATLLFCSFPSSVRAEETASATSNEVIAPCKGLRPFNNLDELLYQFYINLDNDCLFEMPVEELEKVWSISILDEWAPLRKIERSINRSAFKNKPYKSKKDAFYVEKIDFNSYRKDFVLNITSEYLQKYGTLFPDGQLPTVLPKPVDFSHAAYRRQCNFPLFTKNMPDDQLKDCYYYVWKAYDGNRFISLSDSGQIRITAYLKPYQNKILKQRGEIYQSDDHSLATVTANAASNTCKGLKPYKNINELLYQFYSNLDSDCLFNMSIDELEKAWDTKIVYYKNSDRILRTALVFSPDFSDKAYSSERDAFYIEAIIDDNSNIESFVINQTHEARKKQGTLLPDDHDFPEGFPAPLKEETHRSPPVVGRSNKRTGKYADNNKYYYYWLNSGGTKKILLDGGEGRVGRIEVSSVKNSGDTIPNSERSEQ